MTELTFSWANPPESFLEAAMLFRTAFCLPLATERELSHAVRICVGMPQKKQGKENLAKEKLVHGIDNAPGWWIQCYEWGLPGGGWP